MGHELKEYTTCMREPYVCMLKASAAGKLPPRHSSSCAGSNFSAINFWEAADLSKKRILFLVTGSTKGLHACCTVTTKVKIALLLLEMLASHKGRRLTAEGWFRMQRTPDLSGATCCQGACVVVTLLRVAHQHPQMAMHYSASEVGTCDWT